MPADPPRVAGLHHVQITIPPGAEEAARAFYVGVLGLTEIPKPASLAGRGGLWLTTGNLELHIGTEDDVDRHSTKAHVAFAVTDLPEWRLRLAAAGCSIVESIPMPDYDRLGTRDPFGNRLELIEHHPRRASMNQP